METVTDQIVQTFKELQKLTYDIAQKHGFQSYENNELFVPTKLALIGSEVSEALEAHRLGDDGHIAEELADIVIRTLDLAESLKLDLGTAIVDKVIANRLRPYKHGNKRY